MTVGAAFAIRPAGMLALDVTRLEAGLILLEVDYTSARHAMNPEQNYSPYEIGLGRLVDLDKADFVGRHALRAEARAGRSGPPARRPDARLVRHRGPVRRPGDPARGLADGRSIAATGVRSSAAGRSAGRRRSAGARSSSRRSRSHRSAPGTRRPVGTRVAVEWTVEGRRGRVAGGGHRAAVPRPGAQAGLTGMMDA